MTRWEWALAGLCAAWLAALARISGVTLAMPNDLPAWVQAVGSIVAIAAVFLIQRRDHAFEVRQRKEDDAQEAAAEAEGLNLVIVEALVVLDACVRRSRNQDWSSETAAYALAQIDASSRIMDGVEFKRLPSRQAVSAYFRGRQALIASRRQVEMVVEQLDRRPPVQPRSDFFDAPQNVLDSLREVISAYVPERR